MKLETPAPFNFLGLPPRPFEECRAVVLPVPYDATSSYGTGAREGPRAIIEASRHVELYDEELECEPSDLGFYTLDELDPVGDPERMAKRVEKAVSEILEAGKLPIMLGGDHSQTLGAVRAAKKKFPNLSIIRFDAHDDLREEWMGSPFNHACVMRRVHELGVKGVHVGIRSQDRETSEFAKKEKIALFRARERESWKLAEMAKHLSKEVYISFDVDFLDPSIMPSTGTPEPGGLQWDETLCWLRSLLKGRKVVGFDLMELSPIAGFRAPDFLAAKLVYKMAAYSLESELQKL